MVMLERVTKNVHVIESGLNETTLLSLEWIASTALELEKSELCTTVKNGTSSHWKTVRSVAVSEGLTDMQDYRPKPCGHPGCMSHISHPCEGCGKQWGDKKVDCPECLGCGIIDLSIVPCPVCKGTGKADKK